MEDRHIEDFVNSDRSQIINPVTLICNKLTHYFSYQANLMGIKKWHIEQRIPQALLSEIHTFLRIDFI